MSRLDVAIAEARERDQGRCQYPVAMDRRGDTWRKCGFPTTHAHHRQRRSQGGPDAAGNLIMLCPRHHTHVHDHPTESREMGLLVMTGDNPDRQPWMDDGIPEDGYDDDLDQVMFVNEPDEFVW